MNKVEDFLCCCYLVYFFFEDVHVYPMGHILDHNRSEQ